MSHFAQVAGVVARRSPWIWRVLLAYHFFTSSAMRARASRMLPAKNLKLQNDHLQSHNQHGRARSVAVSESHRSQCFGNREDLSFGCAGQCTCGWSQHCYPKWVTTEEARALGVVDFKPFTKGSGQTTVSIDLGVCQISMLVFFVASVLLFVSALLALVGVRSVLQMYEENTTVEDAGAKITESIAWKKELPEFPVGDRVPRTTWREELPEFQVIEPLGPSSGWPRLRDSTVSSDSDRYKDISPARETLAGEELATDSATIDEARFRQNTGPNDSSLISDQGLETISLEFVDVICGSEAQKRQSTK